MSNNINSEKELEEMKERIKIKKSVIEYSTNTLNMEREREEKLYKTANSIITCISILLVAIMSLIFELIDRMKKVDSLIIIFGCVLVAILFVSLFFSIKAHWFHKKEYTRTGKEFINYINENYEKYCNEDGFLDQRINDIDQLFLSLEKNNNIRLSDLTISSVLIYIFLFLSLVFGNVILIIVI